MAQKKHRAVSERKSDGRPGEVIRRDDGRYVLLDERGFWGEVWDARWFGRDFYIITREFPNWHQIEIPRKIAKAIGL